jgi:hypothetical protein
MSLFIASCCGNFSLFSSIGFRDKPLKMCFIIKNTINLYYLHYPLNESGILTGLYDVAQPLHENHRCNAFKVSIENTPASLSVDGNITDSCVLDTGDIGLSFLFDCVAVYEKYR